MSILFNDLTCIELLVAFQSSLDQSNVEFAVGILFLGIDIDETFSKVVLTDQASIQCLFDDPADDFLQIIEALNLRFLVDFCVEGSCH